MKMKTMTFVKLALPVLVGLLSGEARAQETPTPTPAASPVPTPKPAPTPPEDAAEAPVEKPSTSPAVEIGGVLWPTYTYVLEEDAGGTNAFDMERAYVNVEATWGDKLYGRITPDLTRQKAATDIAGEPVPSNTTGSLVFRLKYGYLGYKIHPAVTLEIGAIGTPFVGFEEKVWGHRFVAKSVVDEFYGISSSDLGLSAKTKLLGGRLEVASGVFNGEGYTRPERNKYKEVAARATYQILAAGDKPGLRITGHYSYGLGAREAEKVRGVGLLSYETALFTAAAQYSYLQNGDGAGNTVRGGGPSVYGFVRLPMDLEVLGRVDLFDPDSETDDDGATRIIGGVGYRLDRNIRLVADYQTIDFEAPGATPEEAAFLHMEAKF